jgi:hypothetical protein
MPRHLGDGCRAPERRLAFYNQTLQCLRSADASNSHGVDALRSITGKSLGDSGYGVSNSCRGYDPAAFTPSPF